MGLMGGTAAGDGWGVFILVLSGLGNWTGGTCEMQALGVSPEGEHAADNAELFSPP